MQIAIFHYSLCLRGLSRLALSGKETVFSSMCVILHANVWNTTSGLLFTGRKEGFFISGLLLPST